MRLQVLIRILHYFNSIKVRLKLTYPTNGQYQNTNFNSIKVRLKPAAGLSAAGSALFQFHKGTIKTCCFARTKAAVFKFQFHKGTIKTPTNISPAHPRNAISIP